MSTPNIEFRPWQTLKDVELNAWYKNKSAVIWHRILKVNPVLELVKIGRHWLRVSELDHFLHKPDHDPFDAPWRECVTPVAVDPKEFLQRSTDEHKEHVNNQQKETNQ